MAKTQGYPRLVNNRKKSITPKPTAALIGNSEAIPDQTVTIKDIVEKSGAGFPMPEQRDQIILPDEVNEMLKGTGIVIPSDMDYVKMSKVERQLLTEKIRTIKQGFSEKLDQEIEDKKKAAKEAEINEAVQAELDKMAAEKAAATAAKNQGA